MNFAWKGATSFENLNAPIVGSKHRFVFQPYCSFFPNVNSGVYWRQMHVFSVAAAFSRIVNVLGLVAILSKLYRDVGARFVISLC